MILGHEKQWKFLKKIAKNEKIPHALLFSGQEKLGKKSLALEWISFLLGGDYKDHPDFIMIGPKGKQIQIEQIRELSRRLSLTPFKANMMIAMIDSAHLMTAEAQNSFLKTLEEPKGKNLLILITEYPNSLLSTILSRCENVKFYPVPRIEIENYLKENGVMGPEIGELTGICQGRPGIAIDFMSDPEKIKARKEEIGRLEKILNSDLSARFQYAKDLSQEQNLDDILGIWMFYFRKIMISIIKGGESVPSGKKNYSLPKLKNILKLIQQTFFLISTTNVNSRLAFEILMLKL